MATKKSAFDVLMNKINKKDEPIKNTKPAKKEKFTKTQADNDEIIIISNESVCVPNEDNNDQENCGRASPRKRLQSIKIDPLHLSHTQQYTEKEIEFLSQMSGGIKLKEADTQPVTINLNSSLSFDFTKYDSKVNAAQIPEIESHFEDVTFSLSNSTDLMNRPISIDDTITEEKSELSFDQNDTLNDTLDTCDSPSSTRSRHSKRRRTETRTCTRRILKVDSDKTNQLWTEKYQFKDEMDIVTNKSQFDRLKEWLKSWKSILSKTSETSRKYQDGDDSDSDFSCDSDFSTDSTSSIVNGRKFYSNAILLSGPHGCGKTSSVYAIAKLLGFKIFEVNASSLRNKSQIIQELEGAINSHHVSNNKNPSLSKLETNKEETNKFKLEKFFKSAEMNNNKRKIVPKEEVKKGKKRKNSLRREVVMSNFDPSIIELNSESDSSDSQVNIHKESLILFDEIDVVFREDVGFWAAVNHFIKRSKKPIVLTTTDDFLQEKINLNIERVDFLRPRIDVAVRFLKNVAHTESVRLDTSSAFRILQECKCDMRRALCQLQTLVSTDKTNFKKLKSEKFDYNTFFTNESYISSLLFLDNLTSQILKYLHLETGRVFNKEQPVNFKRFDLLLLKDGLADASTTQPFNPFLLQQASSENKTREDLNKLNTHYVKETLNEYFNEYFNLINRNRTSINFFDWLNFGEINYFNYASNVSMNRLAQGLCKFTSNKSLSLEYRPFLHEICRIEEVKQSKSQTKRRYMHYLSHLSIGLIKEDYMLLASSSLDENKCEVSKEQVSNANSEDTCNTFFDPNIFSNDE